MTGMLLNAFQEGGAVGGIPGIGVRLSIWFIAMFMLAVGGAMIYLRMRELEKDPHSYDSKQD